MKRYRIAAFVIVMLSAWGFVLAADSPAPAAAAAPAAAPHGTTTAAGDAHAPAARQAVLPPPGIRWPAVMLIIVLGMFLAAVIVGPVVRLNLPDEAPVAHAHDDAHGHGHGHGHGH